MDGDVPGFNSTENSKEGRTRVGESIRPFVDEAVRRLRIRLDDPRDGEAVDAVAVVTAVEPLGAILDRDAICHGFAATLHAELSRLTLRSGSPPLEQYPLLTQLIGDQCARSVAVTAEAATRFAHDRAEIIRTLFDGVDPGRLTAIETTTADAHQGGRRVAFLRFADYADPLVYKPRPVDSGALYSRLTGWLNQRLPDLGLADVPMLIKSG